MAENNSLQTFRPAGRPTLIGSLPLTDYQEALRWIFADTPEIPIWPQLPVAPAGGMLNQFVEGIPGVIEEAGRTYYSTETSAFEEEQLKFYEEYLVASEEPAALSSSVRFQVSRVRAAGIYELAEAARDRAGLMAIKAQITGPFTQLTGLHDQQNRLGYYDPTIRDLVVKGLAMKAAWQVRFYKKNFPDLPVLLFIDEPALAGLGSSAFISVSLADLAQDLAELITAVQGAGGLAGVHVCANTDWSLLLASAIDILSFDAYNFFDRFATCRQEIHGFLDRGGIIAWGIVPTGEEKNILQETADSLVALWEKQAAMLQGPNWDLPGLLQQTLITPSCGTGSLTADLARRVLTLTRDVAAALRKKYC